MRIGMNNIARGMWLLKEEYYFIASKEGTLLLVFLRPSSIRLSSPWNHFACRLAISIQLSRIFLTAPAFISIISQSSFVRNSKFAKSSPTNEYIETLLRRLGEELKGKKPFFVHSARFNAVEYWTKSALRFSISINLQFKNVLESRKLNGKSLHEREDRRTLLEFRQGSKGEVISKMAFVYRQVESVYSSV